MPSDCPRNLKIFEILASYIIAYTEYIIPIKTFFVQNFIKLPNFFIMFAIFLYFLYNLGDLCHFIFLLVKFLSILSNIFSIPYYSVPHVLFRLEKFFLISKKFSNFLLPFFKSHDRIQHVNKTHMREWLSWWSTTLPRLGSRVRVPSRALKNRKKDIQKRISFFVMFKPDGRKRRGLHSVPGVAKRTSTGCSATSHAPCSAPMLCVAK